MTMKMFGKGASAIVLVGMALLVQTAASTKSAGAKNGADGKNFESLSDFSATASKRPSIAQTQQMLKRADPNEKIGSVSAKEMLKMDKIGIQYCNHGELDKRKEICQQVADNDLKRYCNVRFDDLIKFCVKNLAKVVRKEIDQEEFDYLYDGMGHEAYSAVSHLSTMSADLKEYFKDGAYYDNNDWSRRCAQFNREFETIKAIVEYSGLDFLQLAKDKGLVKVYELREFCKAMPKKFQGADQGINPDEV